jgi:BirA family biotin operon repressor/biotin-[acetyl-CoA-carboxylase] ligase
VKWPNDVLLNGKKLAGILVESRQQAVVIGAGINLSDGGQGAKPPQAVSLAGLGAVVDGDQMLERFCRRLDTAYRIWEMEGFGAIRAELRAMMDALGRMVRLSAGREQVEGQAMDIDEQGRLLVRLDSGIIRAFAAGEVTVLR